jgi:hypothetical protein
MPEFSRPVGAPIDLGTPDAIKPVMKERNAM